MRYFVKSEAEWMQHRTDINEILYNENPEVHYGYAVVHDEPSYRAIFARGFDLIAELSDDDDRTLDELIEAHKADRIPVGV